MVNPMDLTGRNVMVTGAGGGIGRATAGLLYALGANLTLVDARADALEATAASFDGARTMVAAGSVTDRAFVAATVERSAQRFGGVHGLFNNAGITRPAMIEKMTAEQWQAVIDVNLTGVFNCLQAAGVEMKRRAEAGERDPGTIVNVSSDAGLRGAIGQINYGAAKSGVLGITMSAAKEWARYGIRVNSVAYGVVETPMTEPVRGPRFREQYLAAIPMGRFLTPDEAARSVAFLLSPASVHITGQHLAVNGGAHIAS